MKNLDISVVNNFFYLFGLIFAIPQEYKKQLKKTGVHQEHLTEPWENLEVLTTKVIKVS